MRVVQQQHSGRKGGGDIQEVHSQIMDDILLKLTIELAQIVFT